LNRGNKSATTLSDDVRDGDDVGELRGEGSGNRGITKLDCWWLIREIVHLAHHHLFLHLCHHVLRSLLVLISLRLRGCNLSG